ncbi:UbiD family decarboxylase [Xinfangfangia sp. CPCC 101601]|uniref:UbiD family decarboxylase n=1 Tax=Pseudogemmobacter lacusdianii TaxID=3069608 RepID=A0ABU0W1R3_9RHOB|nr:UbiD family decarboxylase [Xinfangfangia sp. CPCC 101601]MDQ2067904.1 UbiD family decarboxylase [Xinfangfangia sp. CPCC 101601]
MSQSDFHRQDVRHYLASYRAAHPEDVLTLNGAVSQDQDATALVFGLAAKGRAPLIEMTNVEGLGAKVLTNIFGCRTRIARMFGTDVAGLHDAYQAAARRAVEPEEMTDAPVFEQVITENIDLNDLPMLKHFATDGAKYITSGIILAEHPETGVGNLSYHRSMINTPDTLATSLHSRGHLWRLLNMAKEAGKPMPVAMIIGAHPLFMIAASARLAFGEDERSIAGGLLGEPLKVVRTPKYGLRVPAYAEMVLEGVIDPEAHVAEGPFGEFTGYSSDRSTNNLFRVETVMRRRDPILVSVTGGNSAEHLNLGRVPREAEMAEKIKQRFPSVTAMHYPASGTHFHAYVALNQQRFGEARQVLMGILGWDPYLKTVIAVDSDVDITRDEEVLWAMSTHFQPHRDVMIIDSLPGNALDPSASGIGTTSRMGLDATRGPDFHGVRAVIDDAAQARAAALLKAAGVS